MTEYKIATFGCWNNIKLVDKLIPVENVTKYLKSVEADYTDLIILGDNYYPRETEKIIVGDKELKRKIFNQEKFDQGFNMVEQLRIPNKYLIMGNHDIEDTILSVPQCKGLTQQKAKSHIFNIRFPYGHDDKIVNGKKYKYIFVDTTVYYLKDSKANCFYIVEGKNPSQIIREQNAYLTDQLTDPTIDYFLVFGHEPLVSIKSKHDPDTEDLAEKTSDMNELANILLLSNKKIHYICADVHMYQSGTVRNSAGNSVKQIVCGTGGADKDYYCLPSKIISSGGLTFELDNFMDSYGFVDITLTSEGLTHQYIKVKKNLEIMKYSKKYFVKYN